MSTPLYVKIQQYIKAKILSGEWTEGTRIPTDSEFSKQFHCSRITVTTALRELVQDGMIYRVQGKGTFVAKQDEPSPSEDKDETPALAVTLDDLTVAGEHRSIECRVEEPTDTVRKFLGLQDGQLVIANERMKYVDDKPYALETLYLPYDEFAFILTNRMENALFSDITKIAGRTVGPCYASSSAILSDEKQASLMNIPAGMPILRFDLELKDDHDAPLGYELVFTAGLSKRMHLK